MNKAKKVAGIGEECVACGCCMAVCPREAIHIPFGIRAQVCEERCVGCGRCAKVCPAAVISIVDRGEER